MGWFFQRSSSSKKVEEPGREASPPAAAHFASGGSSAGASSSMWTCIFCTTSNEPADRICSMCAKTRSDLTSAPEMPVLSWECAFCTMSNLEPTRVCGTCGKTRGIPDAAAALPHEAVAVVPHGREGGHPFGEEGGGELEAAIQAGDQAAVERLLNSGAGQQAWEPPRAMPIAVVAEDGADKDAGFDDPAPWVEPPELPQLPDPPEPPWPPPGANPPPPGRGERWRRAVAAVAGAGALDEEERAMREAMKMSIAPTNATIPQLKALDEKLTDALRAETIVLIDADFLRSGNLERMRRRQDLEEFARETGERIFVSAATAVMLMESGNRSVGSLTYGWSTPDHPDPEGVVLARVVAYLRSGLGVSIRAVFIDYMSLPQKPRSSPQEGTFAAALAVMADVYASAVGTTVMRHTAIPPRPAALDGELVLLGGDALEPSAVTRALEAFGVVVRAPAYEEAHVALGACWRTQLASHAAAEAAVSALAAADARAAAGLRGVDAVITFHNGRPYRERGWTTLESAVATEAETRAAFSPQLRAHLATLSPKLVEIDGEVPAVAQESAAAGEGAGPRIERIRAAIGAATFTGKGDKKRVLAMYNEYIVTIGNAIGRGGEGMGGTYEGEFNASGEKEGRGTHRFASGDVYEGEWRADKKEGFGIFRYASGDVYEGERVADKKQGVGTFRYVNGDEYHGDWRSDRMEGSGRFTYANGEALVSRYVADSRVGEGVMWSANGQTAWRLQDGIPAGKAISLADAQRIEVGLGVPAKGRAPVPLQ
jgi:hypothetical protein